MRFSQLNLDRLCDRVRATKHAPRDPFRILERRHGLAEIVERGGGVLSPGNKLISGLRDSAVSWAIILPLYWYCEKGAAVA